MEYLKTLVSLVAVAALLVLSMGNVNAAAQNFAEIEWVEVSGVRFEGSYSSDYLASFAGETLPVRIAFIALENESDVRVKSLVSGSEDYSASSERFDVVSGGLYTRFINVQMPSRIDPSEELYLEVTVESRGSGIVSYARIPIRVQRESYTVELLDVSMDSKVQAGESTTIDLVLKNRGTHFAEDAFVKIKVPALGIERKAYFGDLSPVDQSDPDKEDAVEKRMYLSIPSNTPAGVYTVEFEVYTDDLSETLSRKIAVVGASGNSKVISTSATKTFAAGAEGEYALTLVNSGNSVRVYEISSDAPADLTVEVEESLVVLSAGSTKTVGVTAMSSKTGVYPFSVNVYSEGELVKKENFSAKVEGKTSSLVGNGSTGNTTVILTVVLAIIFVVLLVVLIVLVTRKPQKTEELSESYY